MREGLRAALFTGLGIAIVIVVVVLVAIILAIVARANMSTCSSYYVSSLS